MHSTIGSSGGHNLKQKQATSNFEFSISLKKQEWVLNLTKADTKIIKKVYWEPEQYINYWHNEIKNIINTDKRFSFITKPIKIIGHFK